MFARVTALRKLISLLSIALMLAGGIGFARGSAAHAPGLTMAAAQVDCDHAMSAAHAGDINASVLDVCAELCKTVMPDALAVGAQAPQQQAASLEPPVAFAGVNGVVEDMPLTRDDRPMTRPRHPHAKPSLATSRRLLI